MGVLLPGFLPQVREKEYRDLEGTITLRNYSRKTLAAYRLWVGKFQAFVHSRPTEQLGTDEVRGFLTECSKIICGLPPKPPRGHPECFDIITICSICLILSVTLDAWRELMGFAFPAAPPEPPPARLAILSLSLRSPKERMELPGELAILVDESVVPLPNR